MRKKSAQKESAKKRKKEAQKSANLRYNNN
jgi:hypothetical protein